MQIEGMSPEAVVAERLNEWDGNTWPGYEPTVEGSRLSLPRRLVRWILFDLILRRPPSQSGDPAWHTDEEIAASLIRKWDALVESHYEIFREYVGEEEIEAFRSTRIEVVAVDRRGNDRVTAFVRMGVERDELPGLALALLLGTRTDLAREVDRIRRGYLPEEIPSDWVVVYCLFKDGEWDFVGAEDEATEPSTRVSIGEPVQLQTSWKEPPFAVTILGPPEVVDQHTVRVPSRITSIIPKWSYGDIGGNFLAMLYTRSDTDEEPISWDNNCEFDHRHPGSLHEGSESSVVLVKGGSHEGFLYFQSDDSNEDRTLPDAPFVELQYADESDDLLIVDLTRASPIPERVRFDEGRIGTIWDDPPVDGVGVRLKGSQWEELKTPPVAAIGDTVSVTDPDSSEDPWFNLTVLEPPSVFDDRTLRIRLRITARAEDDLECRFLDFQLSSGPDTLGRIHYLWESGRPWNVTSERPDSFTELTLAQGQTHEAFVYFSAPDGRDASALDSLTLLWYGMGMFEMPIFLDHD